MALWSRLFPSSARVYCCRGNVRPGGFVNSSFVTVTSGIKVYEVDYQRRYWMDVFESFTRDCAVGLTPNPDLACNQHIKCEPVW
ncbi:unnamed protein product [Calypogeia fissa]